MKVSGIITIAVVLLLTGGIAGYSLHPCAGAGKTLRDTMVVHSVDTVMTAVPGPTIRIARARVKVRAEGPVISYVDTSAGPSSPIVLSSQAFRATLDTVITRASGARDTVSAEYSFPPPRMSILLRQAPDSFPCLNTRDSIFIPPPAPPWYDTPSKMALGGVIGAVAVVVARAFVH